MRVLVTGATGFVGKRLLAKLDRPVVLSRDRARAAKILAPFSVTAFEWDPDRPPPAEAFDGVDAVIHLAGDPVAEGRWTESKKKRIRDSRVVGTRNLVTTLRAIGQRPSVLVSASAVGIYGDRGEEQLSEQSPHASDFLAQVCKDWEHEALEATQLGMRVATVRVGIVLGEKGGALGKMLTPFYLGLGSPLGSGNQYMPWIHIDDLVGIFLHAARHSQVQGPLNGVAPNPVTNREFAKTLGKVIGRWTFLPPVPGFVLRAGLGEFANVLMASLRVYPVATKQSGYVFQYPELELALRQILRRS